MSPVIATILEKIKLPFFRLVLLCLISVSISNKVSAQAPGMLEFEGKTTKDGKPLSGATVIVYRNGTIEQAKIKTGKNGKFAFSLVFGTDYKIAFSYPGCVDMHLMVYTGKLPKEKNNIFPLYVTEVPFFETTNTSVRIAKYKNPFNKVIYDGKKGFMDDEAYLAQFLKDILIDQEEINRQLAAKEKAENDKLLAEKAKKDAEEKAKLEAIAKAAYEARLAAEEKERAAELARLKEAANNKEVPVDQSMETEAIRLQREKEAKNAMAKKNKEIKTNYENDLLKMVAENERIAKQKAYNKQKDASRTNTVIAQMRSEADVKAKSDKLREEQK
ncbi:MAG TPA: carboxypeptidase regulatory-like domain-containing protein [Bacteroidia bacterium]|nr:carboxypeptidase regulatory-like domain-containing protein [Bacteroidia bacterium]